MGDPTVRTTVGYLVVVILLLAGGEVFRRTAKFEDAFSAAQERLTTQNPSNDEDEPAAPLAASFPVVGPPIRADLQRQRALEAYWRGDYRGADVSGSDGTIRVIAANAMFRDLARRPGLSQQVLVQGLDAVLKAYVSVLEVDPNAVDAAYNYEFVSRLRGALAAGRGSVKLPSTSNMHGDKGAPPTEAKPGEFNIIVPLSPEERKEQIDPGAGAVPQRKG